jgi:hypothetical protein
MNRRPAATLMEVLVSIFIMGIGLLAILALFPLGAFRMAQAIQDDRAAHLGLNGLAVAQTFNLRNDPLVTAALSNNPPRINPPGGPPTGLPGVHPDRPGYPAYLDPLGLPLSNWVGGNAAPPGLTLAIQRTDATFVRTPATPAGTLNANKVRRWFTLTDDIRFNKDGVIVPPGELLEREGTLTYALMFRQPRSSVPNVVEVSVVVYSRRPLITAVTNEYPYPAAFNPTGNTVTLFSTGLAKPPVRPGSWILDATYSKEEIPPGSNQFYGWANAYFYRVVSVNEVSPDQFELEVATPLRRWPAAGGNGTAIVMDNVVEVIERGTGW